MEIGTTVVTILNICGGCSIPVIFAAIVFVSEFSKLMLNWDGSYLFMSWIKIWRIERAYRDNDMKTYRRLKEGN